MGESQSRYSIVERLTQTKLDIISAKADLDLDVKNKEQKITQLKKDFEQWEKDVQNETERTRNQKLRDIEKSERDAGNVKERLTTQREVYDTKLVAIESALKSIEEISRSSAEQSLS